MYIRAISVFDPFYLGKYKSRKKSVPWESNVDHEVGWDGYSLRLDTS